MSEAISNKDIMDELKRIEKSMATKKEVDYLAESLDIAGDTHLMQEIRESLQDMKKEKTKTVFSVHEMIEELE